MARSLDIQAERQRSNKLLGEAVTRYQDLLDLGKDVPDEIFRKATERCIDRMRFRGLHSSAISVHQQLIARFPSEPMPKNQLAVTFLMQGRVEAARQILEEVLNEWPSDGFAQAHLGFVVKTTDNNNKRAVDLLRAGIESGAPGTDDGRFFFHLGDALHRLGQKDDAVKVYEEGAKKGLFLSQYQRSLYNVDRLTGRPWWTVEQTGYKEHFREIEKNWNVIRAEGLALLSGSPPPGLKDEAENLRDTGQWKQFELFARGRKITANCERAPKTCELISRFPAAATCKRGQVKFSVMHPGTHVWAHTGPTNCRLRAHLGLVVPPGLQIRVAEETRSWKEGSFIIFDDSFEHEVWHNGTSPRLVLIVDVWHPELSETERRSLAPI